MADREGSFESDRLKPRVPAIQRSGSVLPHYAGVQGVPGIVGFLNTSVRHNAVHDNVYAKTYAAIQEAGKVLSFHTGYDWDDPTFGSPSRFVAVQAIGYPFYNVVHCVNWLCNAMNERFPELDVLWMEGGLAWVLWVNQRTIQYRMRSSEVPPRKLQANICATCTPRSR